jgi:hypothetical protein
VAIGNTATFLEGGGALLVGTVEADGAPCAARGWGITVMASDGPALRVQVVLDAGDERALRALAATGAVSVTATDVRTLRSIQLKGRAEPVVAATEDDIALARRYCDDFFEAINEADGIDQALLERLVPAAYVTCEITVHHRFDQTPGPGAGAPITAPHETGTDA